MQCPYMVLIYVIIWTKYSLQTPNLLPILHYKNKLLVNHLFLQTFGSLHVLPESAWVLSGYSRLPPVVQRHAVRLTGNFSDCDFEWTYHSKSWTCKTAIITKWEISNQTNHLFFSSLQLHLQYCNHHLSYLLRRQNVFFFSFLQLQTLPALYQNKRNAVGNHIC